MFSASRAALRAGLARRYASTYSQLVHETRGGVALVTLNREKQLNALTPTLVSEISDVCAQYDDDASVGCIVLTGSGNKAFAAGADIKFMNERSYMEMFKNKFFQEIDTLSKVRTPIIAAVNGFALGGGGCSERG